jgi:hypothetical protein
VGRPTDSETRAFHSQSPAGTVSAGPTGPFGLGRGLVADALATRGPLRSVQQPQIADPGPLPEVRTQPEARSSGMEIVTQAKNMGLDVRAGVHTGEVEVRPDDVSA